MREWGVCMTCKTVFELTEDKRIDLIMPADFSIKDESWVCPNGHVTTNDELKRIGEFDFEEFDK